MILIFAIHPIESAQERKQITAQYAKIEYNPAIFVKLPQAERLALKYCSLVSLF